MQLFFSLCQRILSADGTSDFLPELRSHASARWYLVPLVLFGATLIYAANIVIGLH